MYDRYDTRARAWSGRKLLARSQNSNDQYLLPTIDAADDGKVVVCYWTHRTRGWSGQMTVGQGQNWTAAAKVNVDTYGVRIDHQVVGDDVWFAYRTATGGYGIRARRFDLRSGRWGSEGELRVSGANSQLTGTANNSSCLAVGSDGTVHVLWASGGPSVGRGALWLSSKTPSSRSFSQHLKVADDASIRGGNNTYEHFTLSIEDGRPLIFYAPLSAAGAQLFLRIPVGSRLTPALRVATGANGHFARLSGMRTSDLRSAAHVLAEQVDGRALRIYVRGDGAAAVEHVRGCAGAGGARMPLLRCDTIPRLGNSLSFLVSQATPNSAGAFFVGADARRFGSLNLPLPLDGLGFTNCLLAQAPLASAPLQSGARGTQQIKFTYPQLASLRGVPIFWQALMLAPRANPRQALFTNGLATIAR